MLDTVKPPMIEGSVVAYACKVIDKVEVKDHTLFIGEILEMYSDSEDKKHLFSINYNQLVSIDLEGNSNFDLKH